MLFTSTYLIILCIQLLVKSSVPLKRARSHDKLYSSIEAKPLSRWESDNLMTMLNFIRESPEFHPLTFSVVLPEFQSSFIDFLLEYAGKNSIEAYKVRVKDLSLKATWMDRIHLTWIIVVRDLASLNIFIYWQREFWKARDQYLIVFTSNANATPWRDIFRSLWKQYNVYRAVVITADDDFRCLMRYMPFEVFESDFGGLHRLCLNGNSTEIVGETERVKETSRDRGLRDGHEVFLLNGNVRLFENFQNLNRYPLNVAVFESLMMDVSYDDQNRVKLGKPDANVLFTLEKALGAKFRIKAMRKAEFKEDPFTAALRDIESGKVEMIITGFFVKIYTQFRKFQFTSAMYEDKLCFLAPDSGLVSKAYMPLLPFQKDLWALLMLYNVLITFLWCFLKHVDASLQQKRQVFPKSSTTKQPERNERFRNQLLNPYSLIAQISNAGILPPVTNLKEISKNSQLGDSDSFDSSNCQDPPEIPRSVVKFFAFAEHLCYPFQRSETPAQRALLLGTLFFGLIVNGLYQSYLVSSLSKPFHYPQIQTLEGVIDSGKVIITRYENLKNVFLGDSELDMKLIERIHIRRTNNQQSTKDLVAYEDKISISRYYTMVLGDFGYYDDEGNPLIYIVDECPMNYRLSYILKLHSPYAEKVDFVILRFREAGLLNFWFENTLHPIRIVKMRREVEMDKKRIKLSLDHYSLTFLLLLVGLLSSAVIFFGELYVARRSIKGH